MCEWISVDDRLPEIADMVIVCTLDGVIDTAWRTEFSIPEGKWDTYSGRIYEDDIITHWMPLPKPPWVNVEETAYQVVGRAKTIATLLEYKINGIKYM